MLGVACGHTDPMTIASSRVSLFAAAAVCGMAAVFPGSLGAQSVATPSFTEAQAVQRKAVCDLDCLSCHGANLDDGEFGRPLKGLEFRIARERRVGNNPHPYFDGSTQGRPRRGLRLEFCS